MENTNREEVQVEDNNEIIEEESDEKDEEEEIIEQQVLPVEEIPITEETSEKKPNVYEFTEGEWRLPFQYSVHERDEYDMSIISAYNNDQDVHAAREGKVMYVGKDVRLASNDMYCVIVQHNIDDKRWISSYGRLTKTFVKQGDTVNQNTIIGNANRQVSISVFSFDKSGKKERVPIIKLISSKPQ